MNEVFEELKNDTALCMYDLLDDNNYGSDTDALNYFRNNKDALPDWVTKSPLWMFRMYLRYAYEVNNVNEYGYNANAYEAYADINEKVLYDYSFADKYIRLFLPHNLLDKYKYETRQIMWREAQREKALVLYGKIPDDILNEILNFI
jgi:hypothetical protein